MRVLGVLLAALLSAVSSGEPPWLDPSLPLPERAAALADAVPRDLIAGQLACGNFGCHNPLPAINVSSFDWSGEACHGLLLCGLCGNATAGQAMCDANCPNAPTLFPQVVAMAASLNASLWHAVASAISTEARAFANINSSKYHTSKWAPNMNLLRDPRWGRAQEVSGEDPMVSAEYTVNYVRGMQEGEDSTRLKIAATCKHAFAYSLEGPPPGLPGTDRHHFNAAVTAIDAADTYFPAFRRCIQEAHVSQLMCSYNEVNGTPSCVSAKLLTSLVRHEWRFNGSWVSDCGALADVFETHRYLPNASATAAAALQAGLDLNCGGILNSKTLEAAIAAGDTTEARLRLSLRRLFEIRLRLGEFDPIAGQPYRDIAKYGPAQIHSPYHASLALDAAVQSVVMLKNRNQALPLPRGAKLAVIGPLANATEVLKGNYAGNAVDIVAPLKALLSRFHSVAYAPGSTICGSLPGGIDEAVSLASSAEAVLILVGLDGHSLPYSNQTIPLCANSCLESESCDRKRLGLPPPQVSLAEAVAKAVRPGTPVVVVAFTGGAVDLSFAQASSKIGGILWAGPPGEAGGQGVAQVVSGEVSPSGRLTQTFYKEAFTSEVAMADMRMRPHSESQGRGYRFYRGPSVLFPFGHGLSYTHFEYEGLAWSRDSFVLSGRVRNAGAVESAHSVLVFGEPPRGKPEQERPRRILLGFSKLKLSPGQSEEVRVQLRSDAFMLADHSGRFATAEGTWQLSFGGPYAEDSIMVAVKV